MCLLPSISQSSFTKNKKQKIKSLYLGDSPNYNILKDDLNKGINVSLKDVANLLSNKKIIAIYQGKNELGKRALGNRSFLYDPRDSFAKEKIKASEIREFLEKLLFIFGLPSKTEIYPKQTSLVQ